MVAGVSFSDRSAVRLRDDHAVAWSIDASCQHSAALPADLVVRPIGAAAGGAFETIDAGQVRSVVSRGGIITMTVVPIPTGPGAAVLLSHKRPVQNKPWWQLALSRSVFDNPSVGDQGVTELSGRGSITSRNLGSVSIQRVVALGISRWIRQRTSVIRDCHRMRAGGCPCAALRPASNWSGACSLGECPGCPIGRRRGAACPP